MAMNEDPEIGAATVAESERTGIGVEAFFLLKKEDISVLPF